MSRSNANNKTTQIIIRDDGLIVIYDDESPPAPDLVAGTSEVYFHGHTLVVQ